MGKGSWAKGKRGELELRNILQGYGYQVNRGVSMNYGTEPDLSGLPFCHIEVKRQERLCLNDAIKQARIDSQRFHDGLPCVFHRANNQEWKVSMPLADWMKLYAAASSYWNNERSK